jgi:hypothetical protein
MTEIEISRMRRVRGTLSPKFFLILNRPKLLKIRLELQIDRWKIRIRMRIPTQSFSHNQMVKE